MSTSVQIALPEQYGGMKVHFLVFENVTVGEIPPRIKKIAREIERKLRDQYTAANIVQEATVASWLELYRRMGLDTELTKPACLAMAERVLRGRNIPKINSIVDIANIVMARHLHPVGAFDFGKIVGTARLRLTGPNEQYVPLFESDLVAIPPGEIVYSDDAGVFSRYSKDADRTRITDGTKTVLYVIDGTPAVQIETLDQAAIFLKQLLLDQNPQSKLIETASLSG